MYPKRLSLIIISIIYLCKTSHAQFELKVKSNNTYDSIAYLRGVVFDDKNFIPKDTIKLYKGFNTVKYSKSIVGGIYFLYFPKSKQKLFLTLENNDKISLALSDSNYLQSVTSNNVKNDSFFAYQKLEKTLSFFDSAFDLQIKQGKKFNLALKASFFETKNKQLTFSRMAIMKTLKPTSALYLYFDALNKLDASVPSRKQFDQRIKFFHSIDMNAPKLLFTPIIKQAITEYLSYYPMQADSIIKGVDTIMQKLDCKGKAYPYVFDQLTKILKNREIQNNTIAYTYLIKKYVKENNCKFLDPKFEKLMIEELDKLTILASQDTSVNIILRDTAGVEQNLHDFAKLQDLTLITFFDPSCEHCKVELPKMDSTLKILEQQFVIKIGKFTICNDMGNQQAIWKSFIKDNELANNYIHVSLGSNNEIRKLYDAYINPLFYLINKQGKFVGKKISVNTLKRFIVNYIQSGK
jgi:hypothetical protein